MDHHREPVAVGPLHAMMGDRDDERASHAQRRSDESRTSRSLDAAQRATMSTRSDEGGRPRKSLSFWATHPDAQSCSDGGACGVGSSSTSPEGALEPCHEEHNFEGERSSRLEDDLRLILSGRDDWLVHFRPLFHAIPEPLIRTMAFWLSHRPPEALESLATFLTSSHRNRKDALKALLQCVSPPEASWQHSEPVVEGTLEFLTCREMEWEYFDHSEMNTLYELRALCLFRIENPNRVQPLQITDTLVLYISTAARLIEMGLHESLMLVVRGMDLAGSVAKAHIRPDDSPMLVSRDAVVALAYSDALLRGAERANEVTRRAAHGLRDATVRTVAEKWQQIDFEDWIRHEPTRLALQNSGKILVAVVGAAAVVGEATVETTRGFVRHAADVVADIIEYKYGTSAGQVVRNAGVTASHVLRTAGNVALLEGRVLAKSVARSTGKLEYYKQVPAVGVRELEEYALQKVQETSQQGMELVEAQLRERLLPAVSSMDAMDYWLTTVGPAMLEAQSHGQQQRISERAPAEAVTPANDPCPEVPAISSAPSMVESVSTCVNLKAVILGHEILDDECISTSSTAPLTDDYDDNESYTEHAVLFVPSPCPVIGRV